MKLTPLWTLCLLATVASAQAADLTPSQAAAHIGETATVCGTVASAHFAERSRGSPTFLDLGHAYPHEDLIAVIWGEDRAKFGTPESLAGQRICVSGTISYYRGKPQIVVRDPGQVKK